MALQNFVDYVSTVTASWLNKVDVLLDTVFQNATTAAEARTALGVSATGADTTYNVKTANLSDVSNAATARSNLGAAASGAVGSSGVTMTTARLLGRTTASTGAVEEITVGSGLSLSAGSLSSTVSAISAATQAEQETGSSTTVYVSPGRQHYHPAHPKAWVKFTVSGGTVTIGASYNVTSVTRNGTGDFTVNFTNAFSSANYAFSVNAGRGSNTGGTACGYIEPFTADPTTSAFRFITTSLGGSLTDPNHCSAVFYGDMS